MKNKLGFILYSPLKPNYPSIEKNSKSLQNTISNTPHIIPKASNSHSTIKDILNNSIQILYPSPLRKQFLSGLNYTQKVLFSSKSTPQKTQTSVTHFTQPSFQPLSFSQVKLVITDMGGTMIDPGSIAPAEGLKLATQHTINRFFQSPNIIIKFDKIYEDMGKSKREHINLLFQHYVPHQYQQLSDTQKYQIIESTHDQFVSKTMDLLNNPKYIQLLPNAIQLFDACHNHNISLWLNTGYPPEIAQRVFDAIQDQLSQHGLTHTLKGFVTPTKTIKGRPYPDQYMTILNTANINPNDTILHLDDTLPGHQGFLQAAKQQSVTPISIIIGNTLAINDIQSSLNTDNVVQPVAWAKDYNSLFTNIIDLKR